MRSHTIFGVGFLVTLIAIALFLSINLIWLTNWEDLKVIETPSQKEQPASLPAVLKLLNAEEMEAKSHPSPKKSDNVSYRFEGDELSDLTGKGRKQKEGLVPELVLSYGAHDPWQVSQQWGFMLAAYHVDDQSWLCAVNPSGQMASLSSEIIGQFAKRGLDASSVPDIEQIRMKIAEKFRVSKQSLTLLWLVPVQVDAMLVEKEMLAIQAAGVDSEKVRAVGAVVHSSGTQYKFRIDRLEFRDGSQIRL